jgi:hypothetical protein
MSNLRHQPSYLAASEALQRAEDKLLASEFESARLRSIRNEARIRMEAMEAIVSDIEEDYRD